MLSFNAGRELPRLQQTERFWKYSSKGQLIIKFFSSLGEPALSEGTESGLKDRSDILPDHDPRDRFMDIDNDHLLDIVFESETTANDDPGDQQDGGHQPLIQSMPIEFIRSFCLDKVFSSKVESVEFDLALTALDYLQDLEWTRRDVLQGAIDRLGIAEHNWQEVLSDGPEALEWVKDTQYWNTGLELCFAELYVGLRIWIMVYELTAKHIVKNDALAMLNTLFPPCVKSLPRRIPPKVIHLLRATFYRYLLLAEASGPSALDGYIRNLEAPGNKYAWKNVRECITDYIHHVDDIMRKARQFQNFEYFKDEHAGAILHSQFRFDCGEMDNTSPSQSSESPILSDFSRTSSTKSDTPQTGHEPNVPWSPSPIGSTNLDTPCDFGIISAGLSLIQESDVECRENLSSEVRRRVLEEQRVISFSGRPITSDDVILPGTPFLPDTPEATDDFNPDGPVREYIALPSTGADIHHPDAFETSSSKYGRPVLKSEASLPELLRKRLSFGSHSTSRTLRESFKNQNGLGISMGLSRSAENLTDDDPNAELPKRTVEREHSPVSNFEDSISIHSSSRSRSGAFRALRALLSRAGSRQSEAIEESASASSRTAHQIKKKRSLPAIFFRRKSSPSRRDSEPLYLEADDEFDRYISLSKLQPVKSLPIMRRQKLGKAKSCFTLKSVADSQATIKSSASSYGSTKSKKLTEIKSVATLRTALDSPVALARATHRKKLQKLPKSDPKFRRYSSPQSPVPGPGPVRTSEPIKFNWDPNSDDWKSREYTREYYLEKHRAQRFNLKDPEDAPYRSTAKIGDRAERQDRPRAAPKDLVRPNAQRLDSIFKSRASSKTPTSKSYTIIDINKYTK